MQSALEIAIKRAESLPRDEAVSGEVLTGDAASPVKRFVVFKYDHYYPSGGWSDLAGSFDTLAEAKACAEEGYLDFREIVDLHTGQVF